MKILQILFFVTLFNFSCATEEVKKNYVFAEIKSSGFTYLKDTSDLKLEMIDLLFFDTINPIKPEFDKVEILKKITYGDTAVEYYSFLLHDSKQNIKVSKWLEKVGEKLFVIDDPKEEDAVKLDYIACIGTGDCFPEIVIDKNEKYWGCGKDMMCNKDSKCTRIITMY